MSTRANIKIMETEGDKVTEELFFYRHSDGYPEGSMPTLEKFMRWVKKGYVRDNIGQAAGWLILLGAMEYKSVPPAAFEKKEKWDDNIRYIPKGDDNWKVGAYEPTTCIHGDIEYLYEVDLSKKEIRIFEVNYEYPKKINDMSREDWQNVKQVFKQTKVKKF